MKHNDSHARIFYKQTAARHGHLCPRQVLGVRMGLLAAQYFQYTLPQRDKRLLTIVETDGCFADGIAVATGCELGRRTLRLVDYGKIAATFIDINTGSALRVVPHPQSRKRAQAFCSELPSPWHRYLEAYQQLPDETLFSTHVVKLAFSPVNLMSEPSLKVHCETCGEEVINGREVLQNGFRLCRACAIGAYYQLCVPD